MYGGFLRIVSRRKDKNTIILKINEESFNSFII